MGNPFVHIELSTADLEKAKSFYGQLFDWTLEDVSAGEMPYTMIRASGGPGGGMMKHPMPGAPSVWIPYIEVADIEAATNKAQSLGAMVYKGVTEAMGMGWFSIIGDPTGAVFGLWKSKTSS